MSGGYYDYKQWYIDDIVNSIEQYIYGRELYEESDEDYYLDDLYFWDDEEKTKTEKYVREHHRTLPNRYEYSKETIAEFKKGLDILRKASVYAQRIDWLLSCDDGEESFHERLKEDLDELTKTKSDEKD